MDFLRNEEKTYREFLAEPTQAHRSAIFMVGTGLLRAPSPADPSASGDCGGGHGHHLAVTHIVPRNLEAALADRKSTHLISKSYI
jgi:hypothetical protein